MPKAPTWEDAVGVAEELRQNAGMKGPGQGDPLGTSPGLVGSVMDKMNEQYEKQMGHHAAAFTGQLGAAHAHNQSMAEQERARHDRATEKHAADAISGKGTAAAASTEQKASAADQKHADFQSKLAIMQQDADTKLQAVLAASDNKTKDRAMKAYLDAQKTMRSFEADYVTSQNGPSADTTAGKAEQERLRGKADEAGAAKPPGAAASPAPSAAPSGEDKPPMEGAVKSPDGKWVIQKDGKWYGIN